MRDEASQGSAQGVVNALNKCFARYSLCAGLIAHKLDLNRPRVQEDCSWEPVSDLTWEKVIDLRPKIKA